MAGPLGLYPRWGLCKPPVSARVNLGHPLAQGLVGCWLLNEGAGTARNLVGDGLPAPLAGSAQWATGPHGPETNWPNSTASIVTRTGRPLIGGLANWSIVAGARMRQRQNAPRSIYAERAASGNDILKLGYEGGSVSDKAEVTYRNDGGTLIQLRGGDLVAPALPTRLAVAGTKRGTDMRIFIGGVQVAQDTFGSASDAFTDANMACQIGSDAADPNAYWDGPIAYVYVYNRALTPTDIADLARAPFELFAPPLWVRYIMPGTAVQTAVPISDVSAGTWTASTGSDLYAMLDETVASDSDYILSARAPANNEAKVRLGPLADPNSSTGHVVRYRYYKDPDGGARGDLTVTLYAANGTTVIASQVHSDVAPGVVAGTFTLSGAEADAIPSADYTTGLVLGFTANAP